MSYFTWFSAGRRNCQWGTPTLGNYDSENREVYATHAQWLRDAGVDFLMVDWSNDVDCYPGNNWNNRADIKYLEQSTQIMFEEFAKVQGAPKIAIMIGSPSDNIDHYLEWTPIQQKLDQVRNWFVNKPNYFFYQGKPFVLNYVGTPAADSMLPYDDHWQDDSFTVRHITGFVSNQPHLRDGSFSKYNMWSWEDRSLQTHNEAATVAVAWRGDPCGWDCESDRQGRDNGETYRQRWAGARELGVSIAFIPSFNQWVGCESQPSENKNAEFSTDIEPSEEWGTLFLDITREEVAKFKGTRSMNVSTLYV